MTLCTSYLILHFLLQEYVIYCVVSYYDDRCRNTHKIKVKQIIKGQYIVKGKITVLETLCKQTNKSKWINDSVSVNNGQNV